MGSGHAAEEVPHTGTTIVAVQYDGGVVIGADSRVSTGEGTRTWFHVLNTAEYRSPLRQAEDQAG